MRSQQSGKSKNNESALRM